MTLQTGDRVRIVYQGRTVDGSVQLASENGRSLFLAFEALLGGYAGSMAVLQDEGGVYRDLIAGQPVELQAVVS